MKPIEFKYEKSDIFGHQYRITMPVPKTAALAELCSNLKPDENGNVTKDWGYGKQGWREAVWHFEKYVKEIPVTFDEVRRVMGVVLSMFDRMQYWQQADRENCSYDPDNLDAEYKPSKEEVDWMKAVYREITETFADVLVGALFYEEHTLKEEQSKQPDESGVDVIAALKSLTPGKVAT